MKHRVVLALLLAFAAWPLAHFALVQRYDLDPWKFGGWAMYVTPQQASELRTFERVDGRWRALAADDPDGALARLTQRFAAERRVWGRRPEPSELGRTLLERSPDADAVRIEVRDFRLDRASGRMALDQKQYVYDR